MENLQESPGKKRNRSIIKAGVELLREKRAYSQKEVVGKLGEMGVEVSNPSMSNIMNDNTVGDGVLRRTAEGIQKLILLEIGVKWQETGYAENPEADWKPIVIEQPQLSGTGISFHEDGRLPIAQKVDFILEAKEEIIEFGVVLNTFTSYFFSRSEKEFKQYVEALLAKGVHFKCYLMDPDCEETKIYFSDRAKHLPDEFKSIARIRETIEKLGKVRQQFKNAGYSGTFEIYTYQNIPSNYFLTVDGHSSTGQMMVSHYIYGESRANCPVIEIAKTRNPTLYKRYWASFEKLTQNARQLSFPVS